MRCRLCAAQCNKNAANLFENEANAELNKKIAKYLHVYIETNDPFSTKVCEGCVKNLESFHIFYCLIEEKQDFIHSDILDMVTVKNEPPDEDAIKREPYQESFESQRTEPLDSISSNKSENAIQHMGIKKKDNADISQFSMSYHISENEVIIKSEHFSEEEEIETMEDTEYIVSNEAQTKDAKNKQSYQEHSNNCFTCRVCGYVSLSFEDSKTHYNKDHNTAFKPTFTGKYKRKTDRAIRDNSDLKDALKMILETKCSVREASIKKNVVRGTLQLKYTLLKKLYGPTPKVEDIEKLPFGYKKTRQIFSDHQEGELATYLLKASDVYHGLSTKEICKLTFKFCQVREIRMPDSWVFKQSAGEPWFLCFKKRHKEIPIRVPVRMEDDESVREEILMCEVELPTTSKHVLKNQ